MTRSLLRACTIWLLVACGGPLNYDLASTPKAPGADAKLKATIHEAQNQTELELEVKNLPPPHRIAEGGTDYVAWSRKNSDAVWTRVGAIKYEEGDRGGKMKGSVAETAFDFEVTAEKGAVAASPSADVVFQQRVGK